MKAARPTDVQVPPGLPGTTADKISKLARLITNSVDQPFSARVTNRVLPMHYLAKQRIPEDQTADTPAQVSTDGISLRGPVY